MTDHQAKARELLNRFAVTFLDGDGSACVYEKGALSAIEAALRLAVPDVCGWRLEVTPSMVDGAMGVWATNGGVRRWIPAAPTLADEGE